MARRVDAAQATATAPLDGSFFGVRFDRLTPAEAHGDSAFTVPLFDQFMRRIMPGDVWRQVR